MEKRKRWKMYLVRPLPKAMPDPSPYWISREEWVPGYIGLKDADVKVNRLKVDDQYVRAVCNKADGIIRRLLETR